MVDILERTLRTYVARGTGLPGDRVIPGREAMAAPSGTLYASVLFLTESVMGMNDWARRVGETTSVTGSRSMCLSTYSIQFWRAGAITAARRFVDWTRTETGINWASAAIVDGRIMGANVYAGGAGYQDRDVLTFKPTDDDLAERPGDIVRATGFIRTDSAGGARLAIVNQFGAGYSDMPIPSIVSSGSGAVIAPRGAGFAIADSPRIRMLTDEVGSDWEERAQIDLRVTHARVTIDAESGRVDRRIGERVGGGATRVSLDSGAA